MQAGCARMSQVARSTRFFRNADLCVADSLSARCFRRLEISSEELEIPKDFFSSSSTRHPPLATGPCRLVSIADSSPPKRSRDGLRFSRRPYRTSLICESFHLCPSFRRVALSVRSGHFGSADGGMATKRQSLARSDFRLWFWNVRFPVRTSSHVLACWTGRHHTTSTFLASRFSRRRMATSSTFCKLESKGFSSGTACFPGRLSRRWLVGTPLLGFTPSRG